MKRLRAPQWIMTTSMVAVTALTMAACASGGSPAKTNNDSLTGANLSIPFGSSNNRMDSSGFGQIAQPGGSQQYGIWVSGMGRVVAKPDIGLLSFGVEARGDTVATARETAAKAMTAAMKALKDSGIADKDIQTQQFTIYPIISYKDPVRGESPIPQIIAYQVTNSAVAKVRDLNKFGDVIDAVARAGGDEVRINNVSFSIDDPKPLEAEARKLALEDAMAKGRQIAQVTGVSLGSALFISESGGSPITKEMAYARAAAGAPAADFAQTPISTGESEVYMSVQIVFAIQ